MYNAKSLFLLLKAYQFGIGNPLQIHIFQDTLLDPICSNSVVFYVQKCDFGTPFKIKIQLACKWQPKSTQWHQNVDKFLVRVAPPFFVGTDSRPRSPQSAPGVHFE